MFPSPDRHGPARLDDGREPLADAVSSDCRVDDRVRTPVWRRLGPPADRRRPEGASLRDFDSLFADRGRDRFTACLETGDVTFDRFLDILQGLLTSLSFGDAPGQTATLPH